MNRYSFNSEPAGFGSPRITWAVQRLILANIIIFALQLASDPFLVAIGIRAPLPGGGLNAWLGFQPDRFLHGWFWMPFSYQFIHSGLMHLFFNMMWLFFFGPDVERVLGTRSFFRFYLFCGAGGVLAAFFPYMLSTGPAPIVVGASGAVMGVLVAFAMVEPERQLFLFPLPFPVNARALVIIAFVINVIYIRSGSNISGETHLGGMAMGFLYMKALPMVINFQRERRKESRGKKKDTKVGEAVDNIFKFDDRKRR